MCGNIKKKILNYKINECIKHYYNKLLYGHLRVIAIIKIL